MECLRSSHGLNLEYFFSKNSAKVDETLTLIIVNGREINTLKGLETKVKDGDLVAFIPVAHGG
jgi:molybdopterin converting factor small subunit